MNEFNIAIITSLWMGILTSISPCPLASNIAAISFVSRNVSSVPKVLMAGLFYTFGRMLAYTVLGVVLLQGLLATPELSHFLQKYLNLIMGPILILISMIMLNLISIPTFSNGIFAKLHKKLAQIGIGGAGFLGILFALAFCPTSAALFFGTVIPLSLKFESGLFLPAVYGIATGLPVLLFAFLAAFSTNKIGQAFSCISIFEKWAQRITAIIFLGIGIYFTLVSTIGL